MDTSVSWTEIKEGWSVVTSDGAYVGTVVQADGDRETGVFAGVAIEIGQPPQMRYLRGDQIGLISPGEVTLTITDADASALKPFRPPLSETELLAEQTRPQRIWTWLRS